MTSEMFKFLSTLPFPMALLLATFIIAYAILEIRKKRVSADAGVDAAAAQSVKSMAAIASQSTIELHAASERERAMWQRLMDMQKEIAALQATVQTLTDRDRMHTQRVAELDAEVARLSRALETERLHSQALSAENVTLKQQLQGMSLELRTLRDKLTRLSPDTITNLNLEYPDHETPYTPG